MANMLVTGASGFAGGVLARRLVADGHRVTAFLRSSAQATSLQELGVRVCPVDITDPNAIKQHMEPFDCVFHVAASYRVEHSDPEEFRRVNVQGTSHLVDAAGTAGVGRFVHCSTVGVHGPIEEPPADEEYRAQPNDHYQESKWEGEQVARAAFASGLPGCVVRPAAIYGPGDRRFLKLFRAIKSGFFTMIGSGDTRYHMVYVDDLVDGFVLAGSNPAALGEVFITAGPRAASIREIVDLVADVLHVRRPRWAIPVAPVKAAAHLCEVMCRPFGISPPLYPRRVEFFTMNRSFTTAKAERMLGYQPRWSLEAGIAATARGYREAGWIT